MQLVGRVEPVFCQRRQKVKFYHRAHPVGGAGGRIVQTEVAVTDAEAGAEDRVILDFQIQFSDLIHQNIEGFVVERSLIFLESIGGESRFYLEEAETSAQRIVNHGQTAVGSIHHANDVEIFRDIEGYPIIGQSDLFTPVVAFNQHHQLAEDLAQVSPVDLIDEEKVFSVGIVGSLLAEAVKYTLSQLEAGAVRTVAQHEILVGVVLMELHELHPGRIGLPHHRVRQPFGDVGLSNAGCALQNNIFLVSQQRNQYIIALFIQKNIVQKIGFCVAVTGCLPDGSGVFVSDQIQNKVVLALRELEQASVWLHKELHFLQLGGKISA